MDITPFLELKPAPRAVFDRLPTHGARARFMVPAGNDWRCVTWNAFARMIRDVALWMSSVGVKPGDRAVVFAPNRVEWGAAALAVQSVGAVMVPLYSASTAASAAYVIDHSDAKVVFVDTLALLGRLFEVWSELPKLERVVLLDEDLDVKQALASLRAKGAKTPSDEEAAAKVVPWRQARSVGEQMHRDEPRRFDAMLDAIELDAPSVMLYTSGTTGNPKGVPLSHRNVGVNGRDWLLLNGPLIDDHAVDALWLPMSHIFGFGEMCLGNTLGFTTYLVDPASVLGRLAEIAPSVFMSVPAYWEKIAQAVASEPDVALRKKKLAAVTGGRLLFCLSGGAGLKLEVKQLLHDCGLLIIEGYGLTECSPTLTLNRSDAFRFDSVGKVLPSVTIKLAEDGEILAKGESVFRGYHKDEAATRECFDDDGWFKTGDVGRFTDDGFLQIVDRKKDILVTSAGKNVPPANIELRFADDPLIAHVVVYGDGKKYLAAGIWLDAQQVSAAVARGEDVKARVQSRVDAVNAQLASYETIKRWAVMEPSLTVDAGWLTPSLKVRRKKVYEAFRTAFEALYE